ncbi:hypothetical protein F2P45_24470 [Massilia sp. CCM 8733]|uniref:Type II secretory pathway, pseudopilin PulG n=1 Tax=Massilia mucilaginosa TaxID=2609282 RepID=A0ABX0NZP2_9BURK|nr:hypothetical protein [Massilia mucilaginosa]NHZ92135.1 hypothetical protein [Massilia mucilaginosa]
MAPVKGVLAGRRKARVRQHGAALLLMLAVVGLGAASLLMSGIGKTDTQSGPDQRSRTALAQAREALIGFAVVNGRLPRPALDDGGGREFDGRCDSEERCSGLLPWVTLGIAPGDGWGKLLRYSVTPAMSTAPIQPTVVFGTKSIVTRSGGQLVRQVGAPVCSMATQCGAAVVFSYGREHGGISVAGVRQPDTSTTNADERFNALAVATFIERPLGRDPLAPGGEFDDQLVLLPVGILFNRMSLARSLPQGQ